MSGLDWGLEGRDSEWCERSQDGGIEGGWRCIRAFQLMYTDIYYDIWMLFD